MATESTSAHEIKNAHRKRANRFFFEVVAIQIAAYIIAVFVIAETGTDGLVLLALLSIGVSYLVVMLLFRHADTLILTRLTQLEDGALGFAREESTTPETGGGERGE
ncbi:hypothetical protein [Halovivax gelatinilyticus]|uniref:hypothetical protein n=1 Tax=Halovivax gelatinilyticus TaxID=2961597 RepID=UPI0020CA5A27|nr:hypothetical protein [Halovivax gelatinilyticus]